MTKSNIGPLGPSLSFRVTVRPKRMGVGVYLKGSKHPSTGQVLKKQTYAERELPEGPIINWEGTTPITADEICSVKPDLGPQSARAVEWLRALLANGPVPATVIETQAQVEGIGYTTVKAAKSRLGIESNRIVIDGVPRWEWAFPKPQKVTSSQDYFDRLDVENLEEFAQSSETDSLTP
jgi:hypothetical protein